ncbi:glycosyltransferase family 1 protein [Acidisphaera sp. L21]|uniref:glycosyltransferase family 4 protein n=1 Tax=Acidisphaera sp. L21 TaxID=1641851 RepID=UPI00131D1ABA|nr:glycosyltransferase family 1 protein [Acidisphaera sp. L21]
MPELTISFHLPGRKSRFASRVRSGNAARDLALWYKAAEHYGEALQVKPDDAGILVQLGHALKEAGDFPDAERAYLKALTLTPHDADLLVQLGHFYKVSGNLPHALAHYQSAIEHGSHDPNAQDFITKAAAPGSHQPPPFRITHRQVPEADARSMAGLGDQVPAFYLDFSDLVAYFRTGRYPTGIQRVEIELLKAVKDWRGSIPLQLCTYSPSVSAWIEVNPDALRQVCELAGRAGDQPETVWLAAINRFLTTVDDAPPMQMVRGGVLVNLAPWWNIDYMLYLRHAKNVFGIRYVPVIYDLVPLITPEFLPAKMPSECAQWLGGALMHADAVAVISCSTRRDVIKAALAVRPVAREPVVMALDADFSAVQLGLSVTEHRSILERLRVAGRFVLFVATLEARKNHLVVLQAWARLIAQEGADAIPSLVCVGKAGWQFDQTQAFLNAHPDVADKVILLSKVSDGELSSLYSNCLFTIYSSTYEGWGLPITESLCYGKACVTLSHSSLPEAGGKFADYCPADSVKAVAETAWRLMSDDPYRASREALILAEYHPRTWQDVLSGLVSGVAAQLSGAADPQRMFAPVAFGEIYPLRLNYDLRAADRRSAVAEMLRHELGWGRMENWGTWTSMLNASLAFHVPELGGSTSDLLLYLEVQCPPETVVLSVKIGSHRLVSTVLEAGEMRQFRLLLPFVAVMASIGADRAIVLMLQVDRLIDLSSHVAGEARRIGIGVKSFAVMQRSDTAGRLRMIERCSIPA